MLSAIVTHTCRYVHPPRILSFPFLFHSSFFKCIIACPQSMCSLEAKAQSPVYSARPWRELEQKLKNNCLANHQSLTRSPPSPHKNIACISEYSGSLFFSTRVYRSLYLTPSLRHVITGSFLWIRISCLTITSWPTIVEIGNVIYIDCWLFDSRPFHD